jgi:hypothetical protein
MEVSLENDDVKLPLVEEKTHDLVIENEPIFPMQFDFKKSFRDYVFEFTLPFLAVMAAFLLNNVKEDYAEKQLEKQYMTSIISDLNDDIKMADSQIEFHRLRIAQMDSLLDFFEKPIDIKDNEKVNYLGKLVTRSVQFYCNEVTLEQMKNSATFRLVRNQRATAEIIDYYKKVDVIKLVEGREINEEEDFKRVAVKIFDPFTVRRISYNGKKAEIRKNNLPILNNPQLIREAAGYLQYLNSSRNRLIFLKKDLKKDANNLISFLKKEYGL